jgi:hypothetical protein
MFFFTHPLTCIKLYSVLRVAHIVPMAMVNILKLLQFPATDYDISVIFSGRYKLYYGEPRRHYHINHSTITYLDLILRHWPKQTLYKWIHFNCHLQSSSSTRMKLKTNCVGCWQHHYKKERGDGKNTFHIFCSGGRK